MEQVTMLQRTNAVLELGKLEQLLNGVEAVNFTTDRKTVSGKEAMSLILAKIAKKVPLQYILATAKINGKSLWSFVTEGFACLVNQPEPAYVL